MSEKEVKKICSSFSVNILTWKLASKEGKLVLGEICDYLYNKEKDESHSDMRDSQFDVELQAKCETLMNILDKMSEVVKGVEVAHEKSVGVEQLCDISANVNKSLSISPMKKSGEISVVTSNYNESLNSSSSNTNSSLIELDKSVILSSDLAKWTQTILTSYTNQLKMNQIVAKNICHLSSRPEALFHMSIWAAQPGLDTECLIAEFSMEQTLKSCSE